jgi:hypothetical protein
LIKSALKQNYNTLKSAAVDNDYSEWKVEYLKMIFGQTDNEVIRKSITDQIQQFSEIADKDKWWEIEFDESELREILAQSYALGLEDAARDIQNALYEDGLVDNPEINKSFGVEDENELAVILGYAVALSTLINSGTDFFVKRLSLGSVADAAEIPVYLEKLKSGVDLEALLDDDNFINDAADIFRSNLENIMRSRVKSISVVENTKMYSKGILRQYSAVGFTKKAVQHIGSDEPCEACLDAQALGFVSLDYKFKSKMGQEVETVPLHPDCHCNLIFPKSELKNIDAQYYTGQ